MNDRIRKTGLSIGAAIMALGMAAGVFAATQNQNTSEPQGSFSGGRRGGPMGALGGGALGPGGMMGPMGMLGPVIARLSLTDAQKDQLKGILQAHAEEFKALGQQADTA